MKLSGLVKKFGRIVAVDKVDLEVKERSMMTLLGPSGCGKSTLLKIVAGLEKPDNGSVYVGEVPLTDLEKGILVPPHRRKMGMVFQSYALWPNMTVFNNVALPLRVRHTSRQEVQAKVKTTLDLVRLNGFEARYPAQLSGGEQQRVALARALVYEPKVLLLDEPLSNLDAKLREHMRFELKELQCNLGITSIFVTHDQVEAMTVSNEIAVMNHGRIIEVGKPRDLYENPQTPFAADFVGAANFLQGIVADSGLVLTEIGVIQCRLTPGVGKGNEVLVSIRPEYIRLASSENRMRQNIFKALVQRVTFLGNFVDVLLSVNGASLRACTHPSTDLGEGGYVYVNLEPERCIAIMRPK